MASTPPDPPTFSVFGLKIERKTDLLAATAFLLAMITTSYQFLGFVRGARLSVYPPDRIYLFYEPASDGQSILRFAGDVTFVNAGEVGQDLVVRDVDATLQLDGNPVTRQRWLNSVRLERAGGRPILVPLESAHPIQVGGGSTVSHTFSFAPRADDCGGSVPCATNFVSMEAFTTALQKAGKLSLVFEVRSFGRKHSIIAQCEVAMTPAYQLTLAADDWLSLPCSQSS